MALRLSAPSYGPNALSVSGCLKPNSCSACALSCSATNAPKSTFGFDARTRAVNAVTSAAVSNTHEHVTYLRMKPPVFLPPLYCRARESLQIHNTAEQRPCEIDAT